MVNSSGLTNTWEVIFPGGAFRLDTLYPWMQFFYLGKPIRDMDEWQRRFRHRPMADNFEWGADLYTEMARGVVETQQINIPTLHVTGWNDVVYRQSMFLYEGIPSNVEQRLVVGPWMHNQIGSGQTQAGDEDYGTEAVMDDEALIELVTNWFDRHLKNEKTAKAAPVRVFVMGGGGWQEYGEWPPAQARTKRLHLTGPNESNRMGGLSDDRATGNATSTFRFDPDDPVLTYGGVNSHIFAANAGPRDQSRFDERTDILRFSTPPTRKAYTVAGPMKVELYAASTATDTDFTAKLSVVHEDGYTRIIEDGIVRARYRNGRETPAPIEPGAVVLYEIDMGQTAIRIEPGQFLRLDISSSNFPK
jgi:putative CocE/NonD family hydrolase